MKKLSPNSHIRVLSPSDSIARLGGFEANLSAKETLENSRISCVIFRALFRI